MPLDLPSTVDTHTHNLWQDVQKALALSIAAAVALGFSRFAYALLLPPMQAELGWTYVEAGALNTANGAGYMIGALIAGWIANRWGVTRGFLFGFFISILVLLFTASSQNLAYLFSLRTIGGVSTALTFILGAGLTAAICPHENPRWRGTLLGLYVAGVGVGMLLAGVAIPLLLESGPDQWPECWLVLGLLAAIGLPISWWAARAIAEPVGGSMALLKLQDFRQLLPTFVGYSLFGAGYVGYMTFIMALLQNQGESSEQMIWFWFVLGLVSTVSTLLWGRALGSLHDGRGPSLVFVTSMIGTLPVLIAPGPTAMFISALLFGGSFLAGPTSITIVAQNQLSATSVTAGISLLTAGFAFGQTVGPLFAGAISDATGHITAGFWVSPVLLGLAACVNFLQRPSRQSLLERK